jgi:hypothetical protein
MFIVTGLTTFVGAVPILIFMADFPYNAKFLSPEDKRYASDRLTYDVGRPVTQKLSFKFVLQVLKDPRLWLLLVPAWTYLMLVP